MELTEETRRLTHRGVMKLLEAGVAKAEKMEQPQCIVVVDPSGVTLGEIRMNGSKLLARKSAMSKALTSASHGIPSANVPEAIRPAIAAATGGAVTGLGGGLPIRFGGILVGGLGIGSGTPDQDLVVAKAALAAIGADEVA